MLKRICLAALASCALAAAGDPACSLVPGWTQQGTPRSYDAENLFEYMDGNAEGYVLYGFEAMRGVTCEKSGITVVIDISDFGDADSSYGMFSANRDPRLDTVKIGTVGQIVPRRGLFVKGQYYVEVGANPEGDHTAVIKEWTAALERSVEGSTEPPAALAWFPPGQQTLKLVPQSVLGIRLLKRGYAGQSAAGKAFIVMEESARTASQLMEKLRARFRENTAEQIGDEAFLTTDAYLGKMCVFRKGSYVAGYANVTDGQDAAALGRALAARMK